MKQKWKTFLISLFIPFGVGTLSAALTRGSFGLYGSLIKPPLSPPAWIFPVIWFILYALMGTASYLISNLGTDKPETADALSAYASQLFFNFFWPIFFFNMRWYLFSFLWLIFLWILILETFLQFKFLSKTASYLLLPYLLWTAFAGYLNLGIYLLN